MVDTQVKERETKGLVEELIADSKKLDTIKEGTILQVGNESSPTMVVTSVKNDNRIIIYDTVTGEPSQCLAYMEATALKKKRPDGTRYFTKVDPKIPLKRGKLKCMLHPDGENRQHYNELGFPVCKKANLNSPYGVKNHMQKRHPSAWETIEDARKERERQEDRDAQRSILERAIPQVQQVVAESASQPVDINEIIDKVVKQMKNDGAVVRRRRPNKVKKD